jgi:hypothetical protein
MARIDRGNALTTAMLQPGAKFNTDGFGLVTGTLVFKEDQSGGSAFLARGEACPITGFSFTKVHKSATSIDALGLATYTVDYVGISPADGVSSTLTKTQITGSQGLTSESITTHPNFFVLASSAGFSGNPIAGVGAVDGGTIDTPKYKATVNAANVTVYRGFNGSTFTNADGGPFMGFQVPKEKGYYGKSNYLAPQSSFAGHFYTSDVGNVTGMRDRVGKTSQYNTFNGIKLVPDYVGTSFLNGTKHTLLLSQVSFEDYASLYKVSFEVRFNREGYEPSVYASA